MCVCVCVSLSLALTLTPLPYKAYRGAKEAMQGLSRIFPSRVQVTIDEHPTRDTFMEWLEAKRGGMGVPTHRTSPLVWEVDEKGDMTSIVGGRDDAIQWARNFVTLGDKVEDTLSSVPDNVPAEHGYDYDLVVIGGGSGGLATGREAAKLGAKVAILDFVKPSPAGSKWGLGGTCVNVGCIPKKLMHNAALLGEHSHSAADYGWEGEAPKHNWSTLRQNVQDHIKGLNFGYKVALREEGITYLNKLGKFKDDHTLECTDNKGKVTEVSGARFVVAVGGRPQALDCPGGEHAVTSDDLFMMKTPPGKTCVTVLVRSILLRGFDRDIVDQVQTVMEHNGTIIKVGVLPTSIEKLASGKLLVSMSNDTSEEFDTVLSARGRYMDLEGLGVSSNSAVPLISSKSGKLMCTDEQTNVPHIYAIGDIVEGAPELTPVAIHSGRLLARRLYSNSTESMNYKDIATTVFTPLELGTVGLSEEEAIAKYGEGNVESYLSKFQPLDNNEKVLGMHIGAPNAGEIIQGFGVAFRKGLYYKDLQDTIGIHPTTAEELVDINIKKSSGDSAEKRGC
eukprot:GSChrysophyteH2.ASY1.ANO1.484.1 assembled CDS